MYVPASVVVVVISTLKLPTPAEYVTGVVLVF
jgi:hypothetical protein